MRVIHSITTDGRAFRPQAEPEIARILRESAIAIQAAGLPAIRQQPLALRDSDGELVGFVRVEGR
jgi:hypothetical protein